MCGGTVWASHDLTYVMRLSDAHTCKSPDGPDVPGPRVDLWNSPPDIGRRNGTAGGPRRPADECSHERQAFATSGTKCEPKLDHAHASTRQPHRVKQTETPAEVRGAQLKLAHKSALSVGHTTPVRREALALTDVLSASFDAGHEERRKASIALLLQHQ